MFRLFPVLTAVLFAPVFSQAGGPSIVGRAYSGVTVSNPGQPAALIAEFPPGTPWVLQVEWETTAPRDPGEKERFSQVKRREHGHEVVEEGRGPRLVHEVEEGGSEAVHSGRGLF